MAAYFISGNISHVVIVCSIGEVQILDENSVHIKRALWPDDNMDATVVGGEWDGMVVHLGAGCRRSRGQDVIVFRWGHQVRLAWDNKESPFMWTVSMDIV